MYDLNDSLLNILQHIYHSLIWSTRGCKEHFERHYEISTITVWHAKRCSVQHFCCFISFVSYLFPCLNWAKNLLNRLECGTTSPMQCGRAGDTNSLLVHVRAMCVQSAVFSSWDIFCWRNFNYLKVCAYRIKTNSPMRNINKNEITSFYLALLPSCSIVWATATCLRRSPNCIKVTVRLNM